MHMRGSGINLDYFLNKVVENDIWNGTIRAGRHNSKEDLRFISEPIALDEIDLNHFRPTDLISEDATIYFRISYETAEYQRNVWLWDNKSGQFSLSFGKNRTFIVMSSSKLSTGTCAPDYESVRPTFDDHNIFEQSELILNYSWKYGHS